MKKPKLTPKIPPKCEWLGCGEKPLVVGGDSVGCCHKHHLMLPPELRSGFLMCEAGTPERADAWARLAEWHQRAGNYCQHHQPKNLATCEIYHPPQPKERRNW